MFKQISIAAVLAILFLSVGCGEKGGGKSGRADGKLNIVATTGMVADAVKNVGGDQVEVTGLMGPGVDPHLYKASAGDVNLMQNADIIFYNGLHLEGAMADLFGRIKNRVKTVAVAAAIDEARLISPPEFEGAHDPHIWFDVTLWMEAVRHIRDVLIETDSTHADLYKNNASAYLAQLQALHDEVLADAARVPEKSRVLVTAHDAFNYFGRAYGFEVRGLQGISTVTEAGTADVRALAEFIAKRRIPAIFVESSVPRRTIEALQAAVESRGFNVLIGGELFSDAMGNPDTPEGVYTGMVRHNTKTIVAGLSGQKID